MFALTVLSLLPQSPEPAPGIEKSLAIARAASITDVRYELAFEIEKPVDKVVCGAVLRFERMAAAKDSPLVIDFDGEILGLIEVNGAAIEAARVHDHIVLPAATLATGSNEVRLRVASKAAAASTPCNVYRDPSDGSEYCYTLVVPADAHRLYPCFDQPDIKARFDVSLRIDESWSAIGNGAASASEPSEGTRRWTFAQTKPLPTYLMAFACGPFAKIESPLPTIPGIAQGSTMRTWFRESERARLDEPTLLRMHGDGLQWLCGYFGEPYPFDKLDIVLLPGFPYGGMEHAGAIFYREKALCFDHEPTAGELARRSALVYHELSHQWFGNLVTMRWFDDLWLKEGFATFVAHEAMAVLEPERQSWLRFMQRVKPRAYEVDATPGTVPVFQDLANLADAKSAYGPIVYNKAPAVLRELDDRLGSAAFRKGVNLFLRKHRFGNASWRDLADALEEASSSDLSRWSQRWLLSASLPRVRVEWQNDADGKALTARVRQQAVNGEGAWPLRIELLVISQDGSMSTAKVACDGEEASAEELIGKQRIACVVPNPRDVAYAQFLPDAASQQWMLSHAAATKDVMLRAVMVGCLFESVREAELDPAAFAETALDVLARESDADTHAWLLDMLATCVGRYLPEARATGLREQAETTLLGQLGEPKSGRELPIFRWLARNGRGPGSKRLCRAVALGIAEDTPPELKAGKEDRFLALAAMLALEPDVAERERAIAVVRGAFAGQDVEREAFLAQAAIATAESKESYFAAYLRLDAPPEQWAQDSLANFHWPAQGELTRPFLARALEQAQWVKANRKIFFMPAWLDAFVQAHADSGSLDVVDRALARGGLDQDVVMKLLQSRDGLARAVRIRQKFAQAR